VVLDYLRKNVAADYTLDKYNENLKYQIAKKNRRLLNLFLISISLAVIYRGGPVVTTSFERLIHVTKICWILSVPYFVTQYITSYKLLTDDILLEVGSLRQTELNGKKIIFTILTLGRNPETLRDTVSSNQYWISRVKKEYGIETNFETWVITEEDSYLEMEKYYSEIRDLGSKLFVVPKDYITSNYTRFKARALQYATDLRKSIGDATEKTWIYHQDEETMIGEDTILGLLDFIANSDEKVMGSGIILYPQNWSKNYLSIQETTRSANDIGLVGQIKAFGYSLLGYHGSHFLIRADVEEKIGWDFGPSRSEDLVFSIKVKMALGNVMKPLKGFAYEKPPLTFKDQQKQRKRWILGAIEVLDRKDIDFRSKILILYGLGSWLSALPSIFSALVNLYYQTGGIIKYGGFFAGFIWFMIYISYKSGTELHSIYVGSLANPWFPHIVNVFPYFIMGIISDAIGPWNAILSPNKSYDNIQKDVVI
jgi:cellulose synthase/poly-beta-1,6-N-acetylglucosamine synthase-like glycosyltransferase